MSPSKKRKTYSQVVLALLKKIYASTRIQKEVQVASISDNFELSEKLNLWISQHNNSYRKLRIDFYIKGHVAVEVQGEQHDKEVRFSNDILDTKEKLEWQQTLDNVKREALTCCGIPLICIWYDEIQDLTKQQIMDKILNAQTLVSSVRPKEKLMAKKPRKTKHKYVWPKSKESSLSKNWKKFKEKRNGVI